jgi:hypothetical protein
MIAYVPSVRFICSSVAPRGDPNAGETIVAFRVGAAAFLPQLHWVKTAQWLALHPQWRLPDAGGVRCGDGFQIMKLAWNPSGRLAFHLSYRNRGR